MGMPDGRPSHEKRAFRLRDSIPVMSSAPAWSLAFVGFAFDLLRRLRGVRS